MNREYEVVEQMISQALYTIRHSDEDELRCLLVSARAEARHLYQGKRLENEVSNL